MLDEAGCVIDPGILRRLQSMPLTDNLQKYHPVAGDVHFVRKFPVQNVLRLITGNSFNAQVSHYASLSLELSQLLNMIRVIKVSIQRCNLIQKTCFWQCKTWSNISLIAHDIRDNIKLSVTELIQSKQLIQLRSFRLADRRFTTSFCTLNIPLAIHVAMFTKNRFLSVESSILWFHETRRNRLLIN